MATKAQIEANRLNAQKSTGPKTPEGKAAASQNAIKHGLSARRDVVVTESQEDFDRHRDALLGELAPQTPTEIILADRIVSLSWRLKRAGYVQNQAIDTFDERMRDQSTKKDPALTLGRIALRDFSNERVIDRLMMYERRIENSLYKTMKQLKNLQIVRATPCGRPHHRSAPGPVTGVTSGPENKNVTETPPDRSNSDTSPEHQISRIDHHKSNFQNTTSDILHEISDIRNSQNKPNPQKHKTHTKPCPTSTYNHATPQKPLENKPNLVAAKPDGRAGSNPTPPRTSRHRVSSIKNPPRPRVVTRPY